MAVCGSCNARDANGIRSRVRYREPGRRESAQTLGRSPTAPSDWGWDGSQLCQGAIELGCPRASAGGDAGNAARRAGFHPARAKTCLLLDLAVITSPTKPIGAVQRARLCAITLPAHDAVDDLLTYQATDDPR